jgi:hypothetical protein
MLVSLGPAESTKRTAQPVTSEDLTRHAGMFRNGAETIEIVAREDKLFMKRGAAAEVAMVKYGDAEFGPGTFIMVRGADGKTEYVHSGLRSFARVR